MAQRKMVGVVAGDRAVRRSLEFTLEAEGFEVKSHADMESATTPPIVPVECAIIDDDALQSGAEIELLQKIQAPVILLVDPLRPAVGVSAARMLLKPYIGLTLIESVVDLINCTAN